MEYMLKLSPTFQISQHHLFPTTVTNIDVAQSVSWEVPIETLIFTLTNNYIRNIWHFVFIKSDEYGIFGTNDI